MNKIMYHYTSISTPLADIKKLKKAVTELIGIRTNSTYKGHIKISKSKIPYSP